MTEPQEKFVKLSDVTNQTLVLMGEDMLARLENKLKTAGMKQRWRIQRDINKVNRLIEGLKSNG